MNKWMSFFVLIVAALVIVFLYPQKLVEKKWAQPPALDTESVLSGIHAVKAHWPEGASFEVETRSDKLELKHCNECHAGSNNTRSAEFKKRRAHWKINLQHAEAKTMKCNTCHSSSNVSQLKLLGGEAVSMNHAYQTCRQCHFQQARDWAGGAHGKRVKVWAGRRIIQNCTSCHNPHKPQLEKRWPKINVTLPEGH